MELSRGSRSQAFVTCRGIVVASSAAVQEEGTQAALDAYVSRANADEAAAEETLRAGSVWVAGGSCDSLLPVLRVARQLGGVRVVAVGVADATVAQVRAKGLEAAAGLVKDRSAFVEAVKAPGFKRYSDMVIGGLFDAQSKGAGSDKEQSLANFFASQIVVDEAIAQRSLDAAKSSQGALLVVLTGAERVRFGYGVQARLARLATATSDDVDVSPTPTHRHLEKTEGFNSPNYYLPPPLDSESSAQSKRRGKPLHDLVSPTATLLLPCSHPPCSFDALAPLTVLLL